MSPRPSRRRLLAGLAAGLVLPLAACATQPPIAARRIRDIRVDVSEVAARGLPHYAARISAELGPRLEDAFAGRIDRSDTTAPVLTLAVRGVFLASSPSRRDDFMRGLGPRDEFDGVLRVTTAKGTEIRPMYVSREAFSGPWYMADAEDRRLAELMALAVAWTRRELAD